MIVFYLLVLIFILKILLTLITPYVFLIDGIKNKGKTVSTSLPPPIEIPLLLLIAVLSLSITEHKDFFTIKNIMLWGCGAIFISYLHLVLFFVIARLVGRIMDKRVGKKD